MNSKLFIFHQFDPRGEMVGGIGKYVLSFIGNYAGSDSLKLICTTNIKSELFRWNKMDVNNKSIDFFPVVYVNGENNKSLIPLTFRFVIGLLISLFKIKYSGTLLFQRFEYFLPFKYNKNVKRFLVVHNDLQRQIDPKTSELLWAKLPRVFNMLFFNIIQSSDFIFSVNSNSVSYIREQSKALTDKVDFYPTWADPDIFFPCYMDKRSKIKKKMALQFNVSSEKRWLLFVGRFQKQKNIPLLIKTMEKITDNSVLLMAGAGNEMHYIKNMVAELSLDQKIVFLGNIPHSDLRELYSASDIYISTSNFEGMSVALLESLQTGTAVVTTPTGESKRIVKNGINGIVTSGWDVTELVEALNSISDVDDNSIKRCSDSVKAYSASVIVSSIVDRMDRVIELPKKEIKEC